MSHKRHVFSTRFQRRAILCGLVLLACVTVQQPLQGQLVFSEIMFDPGSDENRWEWFELHNLGTSDVDLDGFYIGRLGSDSSPPSASPNIRRADGTTTVIPGGGTAVVYDGDALGFDGQRFRNAWQLSSNVLLIGATDFPSLTNGGTALGLWATQSDQWNDSEFDPEADDGKGRDLIAGFDHALASFDYAREGFPRGNNTASIAWNGKGDYRSPENWSRSSLEDAGVTTSIATLSPGTEINSTADLANPGRIPAGPMRPGLLITEIMYNPRFGTSPSNDTPWEWVEIVNNTGATIDFSETGYVLDDFSDAGGAPAGANITSGQIAQGEVAVLYDATLSATDFATAWNMGEPPLNLIPVDEFPSLGNSQEGIAFWSSFEAYQNDRVLGTESTTQAIAVQSYAASNGWPSSIQGASIYQLDLSVDPNDPSAWVRSSLGDALGSVNAQPVIGFLPDHAGGDVGSPGVFHSVPLPEVLDFNSDARVDVSDVNALVSAIVAVKSGATDDLAFDVNGSGQLDDEDLLGWLAQAAEANGFAEPYLLGDANLDGTINFEDFVALNNQWQLTGGTWIGGDFNADGITDFDDFVALNNNWQRSVARQSAAAASLPEPTAMVTLFSCIGLCIIRRRIR